MVHSRQFMQHKAGCLSTETPKSLKTALIKWHVDFCCYSCYTGVLQTIEKQTSDYKEQNCNIYFKKKRRSKSNFRQTELSNDRFLSIENRVKQLRLRHTYNIYSNKCSAYLKTKHFRKVQNPTDITIDQFNLISQFHKLKKQTLHVFVFNAIQDWCALLNKIKAINDNGVFNESVKYQ